MIWINFIASDQFVVLFVSSPVIALYPGWLIKLNLVIRCDSALHFPFWLYAILRKYL